MRLVVILLGAVVAVSYPFLVHYSIGRVSPALIAGVLFCLALGKLLISRASGKKDALKNPYVPFLLVGIIAPVTILITNNARVLMHIPTLVNIGLFFLFFTSLFKGPPIIENFARRDYPGMQQNAVDYCVVVTRIWCGIFLFNAALCFALAEYAPRSYWLFWTSVGLWIFFGLVFAIEFVIRKLFFERGFQEAVEAARRAGKEHEQESASCT